MIGRPGFKRSSDKEKTRTGYLSGFALNTLDYCHFTASAITLKPVVVQTESLMSSPAVNV
ncbi:MAG: hypothetical protein JWM68_5658 [Verrucomicrobiales bacterium]|nr:hypothetical protein [Verrucomicrobiales bacterium]